MRATGAKAGVYQIPWNEPAKPYAMPVCTRSRQEALRMHGGTSPGAPRGNQHALENGAHTREALAQQRVGRSVLRALRELIENVKDVTCVSPRPTHSSQSSSYADPALLALRL